MIEIEHVGASSAAFCGERARDGAGSVAGEHDVRLAPGRGCPNLDRFRQPRARRHRDQPQRDPGIFECGPPRLVAAAGRDDEPYVEALRQRPQQVERAEMPARVERPRNLARHRED
jgi:hypothetical protein